MSDVILVYGNIAAGKSTFCKLLLPKLQGFTYLCIDDVRQSIYEKNPKLNDWERDKLAEKKVYDTLKKGSKIIFETTAANQLYIRLRNEVFASKKVFYLHIECSVNECYKRHFARKVNRIKPVQANSANIKNVMLAIDAKNQVLKKNLMLNSQQLTEAQMIDTFFLHYKY